jgi:hypothetical protein
MIRLVCCVRTKPDTPRGGWRPPGVGPFFRSSGGWSWGSRWARPSAGCLTEGFDTRDLEDAKALLEELRT